MEILIIKFIMTYLFFATIILLNLLFNPRILWKYINIKTGEQYDVPPFKTILVCLYWIIAFPIMIIKRKLGGKDNEP